VDTPQKQVEEASCCHCCSHRVSGVDTDKKKNTVIMRIDRFSFHFFLMRTRQNDEFIKETPALETIKDWINIC
jgi:hypothetical protein